MAKIAVIGAGLAGLVVSRELARAHDVVVFEKSRGVAGRMATRRAGPFEFDHGAQFFTGRTRAFRAFIEPFINAGVVAEWPARYAELQRDRIVAIRGWGGDNPRYVGVPAMNTVGKTLASGLDIRLETAVRSLAQDGAHWQLFGDGQRPLGEFDWVVVTAPAEQAAELLASTSIAAAAANVRMQACYALLLGFDKPVDLPWEAAIVHDSDIGWISVNSSKPGRPESFSLVVHSTNAWANEHMDEDPEAVQRHLASELSAITGIDAGAASYVRLHRWRYANANRHDGDLYALDTGQRLAACGDWFIEGRVEGAFTSASALAEAMRVGPS